jgi:hypothetical protein
MIFGKRKMYLGGYLRWILLETIKLPNIFNLDNLELADPEHIFTEEEKLKIVEIIPKFLILSIFTKIFEKAMYNKIKRTGYDVGLIFIQSLTLAYEDFGFETEYAKKNFKPLFDDYMEYVSVLKDEDFKNEFGLILCHYISQLIIPNKNENTVDIIAKRGFYSFNIFKNVYKNYVKFFDDTFKNIKLLDA